jgi:prepilin-type N-terminal cleavage/methylation domain-containing protein
MKKGFTLVELMVVVAIIAIISAIVTTTFSAAKSKSRDGQRISDVAQIQLAFAGYFNQCNDFPLADTGNVVDSNTLTQSIGCPSGVNLSTFISKIPTPPSGASQASYSYATLYLTSDSAKTPVDYVIQASLENNSSVSSESLSAFPTAPSGYTYSTTFTCDSLKNYCLSSK